MAILGSPAVLKTSQDKLQAYRTLTYTNLKSKRCVMGSSLGTIRTHQGLRS